MKKRLLRFLPMLIMMGVIFFFSTMEGDDSAQASGMFLKALQKLAEEVSHKGLTTEALASLHLIIRKCAHFTEYAMLGVTIMIAIWKEWQSRRFPFVFPEMIALLYAVTDEVHQYFVPGRYGTATDVLIDSAGALVGIFAYRYCILGKNSVS